MRLASLLVVLLALTAGAQSPRFRRFTQRTDQGRSGRGLDAASKILLEAFTAKGGTPCSGALPVASVGGASVSLTFGRASTATCNKNSLGGMGTTGIHDGDIVNLSAGQPRVMFDYDGYLGGLQELPATNALTFSEALTNAVWTNYTGTGGTAPTVNGSCATSPLATPVVMPMDVSLAATSGAQSSARTLVTGVATAAGWSASIFVEGVGAGGTLDLCIQTAATPTATCTPCTFTSSSWTLCQLENVTSIASGNLYIGNVSTLNGGTARAASRVCMTAAQFEANTVASSYIPTNGATASRAAESGYWVIPAAVAASLSASITTHLLPHSNTSPVGIYQDASNWMGLNVLASNVQFTTSSGRALVGGSVYDAAAPESPSATYLWHNAGYRSLWFEVDNDTGGSQVFSQRGFPWTSAVAAHGSISPTRVYLDNTGGLGGGFASDALVSRICVGSTVGACNSRRSLTPAGSIAMLGDSITAGVYPNQPPYYVGSTKGRPTWNYGVSGRNAAQCLTAWNNGISNANYSTLVLECGVNTLAQGGTASDAIASLQSIADGARQQGVALVLVTIFPWKNSTYWTAGRQTDTDTVNAWILNYCATYPAQATCVNTYAAMGGQGGDPAAMLTTYDSGDHQHPNAAGAAYWAGLVAGAIP